MDERFAGLGGWPGVLRRVSRGESLEADEAEAVLDQVFEGNATDAQIGAFLMALRAKGESVEEMTGLVRAVLGHAEPLVVSADALDVVGTGGDHLSSINVSTIAAFIAAGAGAVVCKHGNRAASSSVGTADVLEALGVAIDLGPASVSRCIDEVSVGFCFAQRFHPAFRFVGAVRRELGIPTAFNFLGPLANPARVKRQLVGVSDPAMAEKMVGVLGANGSVHAMVVYGDDGLDELSTTAPSTVHELTRAADSFGVRKWYLEPGEFGFSLATLDDLRGGDGAFNAEVIRTVLGGAPGPKRDIGVLNAAAALIVAGRATDLAQGVALAQASIDDGKALAALEGLIRVSGECAAAEAAQTEGKAAQ